MSWAKIEFEKLYEIPSKNGLTRPARVRGQGYKMINMGELFGHDRIGAIDMELVPMNDRELENMLVEKGDLLFARQSLVLSGAGKCSIVKEIIDPTTFESHIIRVRLKKDETDPKFFYYYFKSPICGMKSIVIQGVQAGIRGNDLKKLKVHLPDINEQQRIADILEQYDDLIENNRRRIQLLEESARLLYKEWFVHLRFPGHEHVKITCGVPEEWNKKPLKEILTLNYGKALKADLRVPGVFPVYGSSGVVGSHNKPLVKAPGIVVGRKGNVGSIYWVNKDYWSIDTVYFVNSEESNLYLYHALQNVSFINTDVAVPGLNRDMAYSREVLLPIENILNLFLEEVEPIQLQIERLTEYNKKLSEARDILLPRLMNGGLTV